MACGRLNCGNILCSKLVMGGYVCDSCHAELKLYGEALKREGTERDAREAIKKFLDTTPGAFLPPDEAAEAFAVEFDRLVAGD